MTDKQQTMITSKVIYNDRLFEQIYEPKRNLSYYISWDESKNDIVPMDYIEDSSIKYLPIVDDLLQKQCVILPTKPIEYGDEKTLQQEIYDFTYEYVDITDVFRKQSTWYIFLTWITEKLNTIPYLRALGDYGTGKTRFEDVIGGLCYKPMFVGGAIRSAPIFRVIDLWRGTAIFDEFTLQKSDESQDIIQILNSGYQRGKPVLRCKEGSFEVVAFDPFGPKVLATKKQFTDRALESRCITETLRETNRNDIPIDLGSSFFEKRQELQNKLLMYRFKNWNKIEPDKTKYINFGNIQPRIKQTFLPFTVLFAHDEKTLQQFIKEVKTYNGKIIEENVNSFDGQIMNCYIELKKNYIDFITPKDIRNELVNKHNFKDTLNSRTVGKHLKALGFESKPTKTPDGTKRIISIDKNHITRLIFRYINSEDQEDALKLDFSASQQKTIDVEAENE